MLQHHIRSALRGFARNRLTTGVQVFSLWLGLLGFVIAYAIAQDMLSLGTRYPGADRTFAVSMSIRADMMSLENAPLASAPAAPYLREELPELEAIARVTTSMAEHAVAVGDRKTWQEVLFADPDYFEMFPQQLSRGPAGNPLDQPRSAILSAETATALFGEMDPIGATLRLDGSTDVSVAGVFESAPSSLFGERYGILMSFDVNLALERAERGTDSEQPGQAENWFPMNLSTFVRIPADGSLTESELREHLAGFAERRIAPEALADVELSFGLMPLKDLVDAAFDMLVGGGIGIPITTLIQLIGILVLAMSCLNYASLAAAQSYARAKHVGLVKVLGARRAQVFMQSIVEAVLLVLGSLVLALATAEPLIAFLNATLDFTMDLPYFSSWSLWATLGALVAGVALVAGGYPALVLARVRPVRALRAAGQAGRQRIRRLLVGLQFTTASLLLIVVLVMLAHQRQLETIGGAVGGSPIIVVSSELPDEDRRVAFTDELRAHPAIESVSATGQSPWEISRMDVATLALAQGSEAQGFNFLLHDVDYDYFDTLDGQLVAGRLFSRDRSEDLFFWGDTPAETMSRPLHMVVDTGTASRLGWTDPAEAVGQRVYRQWSGFTRPIEIIGVVENASYKLMGMGLASSSIYFLQPDDTLMFLVRVSAEREAEALAHIDAAWDNFAPDIPIRRSFMGEMFDEAMGLFRMFSAIFGGLALLAIFVACVGLFGAATYATSRRRHEIGVRKSLGAHSASIVRLLLWSFTKPVLLANLIAWPIGFLAMQVYLSLFVVRGEASLLPFAGGLAITLAVAWLTVAMQTLKASRVRPAEVLRQE